MFSCTSGGGEQSCGPLCREIGRDQSSIGAKAHHCAAGSGGNRVRSSHSTHCTAHIAAHVGHVGHVAHVADAAVAAATVAAVVSQVER